MSDLSPAPTPTNEQQDAREEWAERLQCADVGVDFPWLTEDGCSVWHEQSEAAQEHYRRVLRLALSAGLQIPAPLAAVSAAAPDERDEFDRQWAQARAWREHVASKRSHRQARRSSFDAGWEAALAARPAPVVSGADVERTTIAALDAVQPTWRATGARPSLDDLAWTRAVLAALGITVADAPAAEPECICDGDRQHPIVERAGCPWHSPAADDEGGQER